MQTSLVGFLHTADRDYVALFATIGPGARRLTYLSAYWVMFFFTFTVPLCVLSCCTGPKIDSTGSAEAIVGAMVVGAASLIAVAAGSTFYLGLYAATLDGRLTGAAGNGAQIGAECRWPLAALLFGYVATHMALFWLYFWTINQFDSPFVPLFLAVVFAIPYIAVSGLWTAGMTPLWVLVSRPKRELRTWVGFADDPLLN